MAGDVMDAKTKPKRTSRRLIDGLDFPVPGLSEPGTATEVADGIFWVSTPVPFVGLKQVNLWLLRDGDGWTMIDCGYGGAPARTDRAVWAKVLGGRPITRLIVTHFHPDHAGGSGWICREMGPAAAHVARRMAHRQPCRDEQNTDHVESRGSSIAVTGSTRRACSASCRASCSTATA